jgi:hypothetical protein
VEVLVLALLGSNIENLGFNILKVQFHFLQKRKKKKEKKRKVFFFG